MALERNWAGWYNIVRVHWYISIIIIILLVGTYQLIFTDRRKRWKEGKWERGDEKN